MATGSNSDHETVTAHFYRFSLMSFEWEDVSHPTDTYIPVNLAGSTVYNDYFYLFFGWNTAEYRDLNEVFRTSLSDGSEFRWEEVELELTGLARDSFGFTLVNDSMYLFGGYTATEVKNSIYELLLSSSPIEVSHHSSHTAPVPRFSHTLNPVYDRLYMFGGETGDAMLNDLWEFRPEKNTWRIITGFGQIPSPRSWHGSSTSGDTLMIWGGVGLGGLLNDLYKYTLASNFWERIDPVSETLPSPRTSACVVLSTLYVFIFGGSTEIGLTDELWLFNTGNKTYSLLSSNSKNGPKISHKQTCSVEKQFDGNLHLYVMMGTGMADEALGTIHYYDFHKRSWVFVFEAPANLRRNSAYVEKIGRNVVVAGGEFWGIHLADDILSIDLDTKTTKTLGKLGDFFVTGAGAYFQNHFYLHGGSNPIGIIYRRRAPSKTFVKYDLFHLCPTCGFPCSLGNVKMNSTCKLCEKGHFLEDYSWTACEPCAPGFANSQRGASSSLQCFPCPQGSYAPNAGAEYCLDCLASAVCPIGSSSVLYGTEEFEAVVEQPDFYAPRTDEVGHLSVSISGGVAIILILLSTLCCALPQLQPVFKNLDIYGKLQLNEDKSRVVRHKNLLGGCCQMICIGVSTLFLSQTLIAYWIDNVQEIKALVPFVILEESEVVWEGTKQKVKFAADIELTLSLENYFAECEYPDGTCHSTIHVETSSELTQTLSCERNEQGCSIKFKQSQVNLGTTTFWSYSLSDVRSYCSGVQAVLTATSSVLGEDGVEQKSSKSQSLYSAEGKVFKGSPPILLYFSAIPSMFTDRIKGDQLTGYHVLIDKSPEPGSETMTSDLQFEDDLRIVIEVDRSENGFMTIREEKEAWFLLLFALIGSLIGIFEIIEILKYVTDELQEKVESKRQSYREMKELDVVEVKLRDHLTLKKTKYVMTTQP